MSDEAEKQICPLPHLGHPDRPSIAAPGSRLCRGHQSKVADFLTQLSTFDAEADQAAHDQTLSRKAGQPLSGDRERPLPIDARITEHRQELHQVLSSRTLLVAEERKLHVDLDPDDVLPGLCRFLSIHHDWSCQQPWADDYAGEILALGRRAWSLLHPSGNRQFVVGRCLERDEVDGSLCPGEMWARLTPSDPAFEVAADLCCDTCDCTVPSTDWMKYGRRVMAAEKETAA